MDVIGGGGGVILLGEKSFNEERKTIGILSTNRTLSLTPSSRKMLHVLHQKTRAVLFFLSTLVLVSLQIEKKIGFLVQLPYLPCLNL
jgi:hypothetical protein